MTKGSTSRTKGHNFERLICKMINEQMTSSGLPYSVSRNLDQTRDGGSDILGLNNYTIECKRHAKGCRPQKAWWDQVTAAAGETTPLLIYKFDRSPVEVMFPAMLFSFQEELAQFGDYNARMLFDDFLYLFTCLLGAQNDARYV